MDMSFCRQLDSGIGRCKICADGNQLTASLRSSQAIRVVSAAGSRYLLRASVVADPFSKSCGRNRASGESLSAILDESLGFLAESGNSALLGVRAETTLRADLLTFSLTFHSRFLARKKRVVVVTGGRQHYAKRRGAWFGACHTADQAYDGNNDDDDDQATRRYAYGA